MGTHGGIVGANVGWGLFQMSVVAFGTETGGWYGR
jgi:hypothetical protein